MSFKGPSGNTGNADDDNIRLFIDLLNAQDRPSQETEIDTAVSCEKSLICPLPPLFDEALNSTLRTSGENEFLPTTQPTIVDEEELVSVGSPSSGTEYQPKKSVKKASSAAKQRGPYVICGKITLEQGPSKLAELQKEITDLEAQKAQTRDKHKLKLINGRLERRQISLLRLQNHLKFLQEKKPQQPKEKEDAALAQENAELKRQLEILKKFVTDSVNQTEKTEREIEQLRLEKESLTKQLSKSEEQLKDAQKTSAHLTHEYLQSHSDKFDLKTEREKLLDKIDRWAKAYDELEGFLYDEQNKHQDQVLHLQRTVDGLEHELLAQSANPMLHHWQHHKTLTPPRDPRFQNPRIPAKPQRPIKPY